MLLLQITAALTVSVDNIKTEDFLNTDLSWTGNEENNYLRNELGVMILAKERFEAKTR